MLKTVLFQCTQVGSITNGVYSQSLQHSVLLFCSVLLCPFHIRGENTRSTTCCILTSSKALWIGFYYVCFSNKETEVQKGAVI